MLTLPLIIALSAPASAARGPMSVANDEVKDGVSGMILSMDGDEAAALKRRTLALNPAQHRVFPVITDTAGDVVYTGRTAPILNGDTSPTTTASLPADDAVHTFFVPYHRMSLEPGEHEIGIALWLDAGLDEGPILVSEATAKARTPALQWVFASVEQPPSRERNLRWRARLGQDVVAERRDTPAVVVLSEGDAVSMDVWDVAGSRWSPMSKGSLQAAASAAGISPAKVRALSVRKAPPGISDGSVTTRSLNDGDPGLMIDLRWALTGRSVDALVPIEARPFVARPDGTRWELPSKAVIEGPDRARHRVARWALPDWINSGETFRLGWVVVARAGSGSPLTRDLVLGRSEHDVTISDPLTRRPLSAELVEAEVIDDSGLVLKARVAWHVPSAMAALARANFSGGWSGQSGVLSGPWTLCAESGAPMTCAEAWGIGSLSAPNGMSELRLPLAWVASADASSISVHAGLPGYHALSATLSVDLSERALHTISLNPKRAAVDCQPGSTIRLVWSARGKELAATTPRPCSATTKWAKADAVTLSAWAGDELQLAVEVAGRTLRSKSITVRPDAKLTSLVEPTAGVHSLKIKVTID